MISVKGVEPKLVQIIMDEIIEGGAKVEWADIAGQEVCIFFYLFSVNVRLIFIS